MPDGLLCVGEGYHFGVGMRTVRRHDEIHPNGYEPAGCGFEHGGAEGSAGFQLDIGQRQLYDEAHTVASGQDGPPVGDARDGWPKMEDERETEARILAS